MKMIRRRGSKLKISRSSESTGKCSSLQEWWCMDGGAYGLGATELDLWHLPQRCWRTPKERSDSCIGHSKGHV